MGEIHYNHGVGRTILILTQQPEAQKEKTDKLNNKKTENRQIVLVQGYPLQHCL